MLAQTPPKIKRGAALIDPSYEEAADYNAEIRKFPTLIYAGWFGFEKKPYFQAATGADKAPTVQF